VNTTSTIRWILSGGAEAAGGAGQAEMVYDMLDDSWMSPRVPSWV
jgi:hypothetical protein